MFISAAKATEAAGVLGVELENLTTATLSRAYRTKAAEHHPDAGGELQQWARVSWAKECLVRWLEAAERNERDQKAITGMRPAKGGGCRACDGQGFVQVRKGFGIPLRMMCVMCEGTGDLEHDRDKSDNGR